MTMPGGAVKGNAAAGSRGAPSHQFRIPSNISVSLGLQWSFIGDDPVDLDASCVAFDSQGNAVDVVFFNNLKSTPEYMIHTGDNTTGEDFGDDDESIIFHMALIPKDVCYMFLCVTSYTGTQFTVVQEAHVRLVNLATKTSVGEFSLGVVGHHTASLLCAFSRASLTPDENDIYWWDMREISIPAEGYTFYNLLPNMLKLLAIPQSEYEMRMATLPDYPREKQDPMLHLVLSQVKFGLGWDGENDLDASCVMLDDNGRYVDHVYTKFGKLKSKIEGPSQKELMDRVRGANEQKARENALKQAQMATGTKPLPEPAQKRGTSPGGSNPGNIHQKLIEKAAVVHSGDKLNGFDVEGDDEFIDVNLVKLPENVKVVYFFAQLYDGFSKSLHEVPRAYVRLANRASPEEKQIRDVDKFYLRDLESGATSVVAYAVFRVGTHSWDWQVVGECMDGRNWIDVFPFLRNYSLLGIGNHSNWLRWRQDVFPFAVKVTIHGVRNLGPQEPQAYSCHAWAWICDKSYQPGSRFRTELCRDRSRTEWLTKNSHIFVVDKKDVVRFMVFEIGCVGYADVTLADFFVPLEEDSSTGSSGRGGGSASATNGSPPASAAAETKPLLVKGQPTPPPNHNRKADDGTTIEDIEMTSHHHHVPQQNAGGGQPQPASPHSGASSPTKRRMSHSHAKATTTAAAAADSALGGGPGSRPITPAETQRGGGGSHSAIALRPIGQDFLSRVWLPLRGSEVTGDVCVSVQRVELPSSFLGPDTGDGHGSWCLIS